jgi:Lon protease-like protein
MTLPAIPTVIPLFPLPNVVLFPQMSMPLHVFEPRYRKMVADVLATHRTIGMALLRPGWERDYYGRPPIYLHGCAGVIEEHEILEHGRYNMLLKGVSRFRVTDEHTGEPYRLASVQPLAEGPGEPFALDSLRRQVTEAVGRGSDGPAVLVMQDGLPHDLFVNALAQSLPLTPVERQSLLECDSVASRYRRLLEILEFRILEEGHRPPGGGTRVH